MLTLKACSTYSSATAYIVIVMVALAEELLALLVTSLLGVPVSATEMPVSFRPSRTNPVKRIAKVIKKISLFTSASPQ